MFFKIYDDHDMALVQLSDKFGEFFYFLLEPLIGVSLTFNNFKQIQ